MRRAALAFGLVALLALPAGAADTVPARLDAARAAHAKGDLARAAVELEAAVAELQARLGKQLGEFLPPPPAGWQAEPVEIQSLSGSGGGLSVSRAYLRDDASLNAALIIDSPAVASAAAQFEAPPQPNARKAKLGAEDVMLRWDLESRTGEVLLLPTPRVLLQIEGDNLPGGDALSDLAKGWNLAGIRKALP
jgi:hypothetical protein